LAAWLVKINLVTVKIAIVKNANVTVLKFAHALLNQLVVVVTIN
jgi:hypothetical protein